MIKKIFKIVILLLSLQLSHCYANEYIPFRSNGLWGVNDHEKKNIIPCIYSGIAVSAMPIFAVQHSDNKWGFINSKNEILIPFAFTEIKHATGSIQIVADNNKLGVVDLKEGKQIIPSQYDWLGDNFENGLLACGIKNKYGFINEKGVTVIPLKYDEVKTFSENYAAVKINNKWGFIDNTCKTIVPFQYDDCLPFSEGVASVSINGKWGAINHDGKWQIPAQYASLSQFCGGIAVAKTLHDQYGLIKLNGEVYLPFATQQYKLAYKGIATVTATNGETFLVSPGKKLIILPFKCQYLRFFHDNLAAVKKDGYWGYIDLTGNIKITPKYIRAEDFINGLARVWTKENEFGYIDTQGNEYWE